MFETKHFILFYNINFKKLILKINLKKKYIFNSFIRKYLKKIINIIFNKKYFFYNFKIIIKNNFNDNIYFKFFKNFKLKFCLEIFFLFNKFIFYSK